MKTCWLGWPCVAFFPDASWPGFLYCLKYLGFGFVCVCRPIGVWHRFLMFSKRSRGTLNQSNIEILARTRPGKMARMVTLLLIWCVLNMCWIINNAVFVFRLNNCELTQKNCLVLATVLSSKTILKEMNLNNSRLLDSGVKEICKGLMKSKLKILKWVYFTVSYTQHHSNEINIWICSPLEVGRLPVF